MIKDKDADFFVFPSSLGGIGGHVCITPEQKKRHFDVNDGDKVDLCPVISIKKANELFKSQSSPDEKDIA